MAVGVLAGKFPCPDVEIRGSGSTEK